MAKPTPIRCAVCGATFGALLPVDPEKVRAQLAGTFLAGLSGMLPDNIGETIMPTLTFECGACFLRRLEHGSTKENREAGGEENRADVHSEADEEGNERRVRRGRFFPGKRRS